MLVIQNCIKPLALTAYMRTCLHSCAYMFARHGCVSTCLLAYLFTWDPLSPTLTHIDNHFTFEPDTAPGHLELVPGRAWPSERRAWSSENRAWSFENRYKSLRTKAVQQ